MIKISQKQKKQLARIARKFSLRLILAFGSEVNGQTHPLSDLDIAVLGRNGLDWDKYSDLIFNLNKAFPGKKIDLVFINKADPLLLHKISRSCRCLYGNSRTLFDFLILSFKKYQDYQPFFRLEERCVNNFIMEGI
jgi:uncharacterized protein YutE (UPF0331/DUF86 family)/predicted nucleotidyltransferase